MPSCEEIGCELERLTPGQFLPHNAPDKGQRGLLQLRVLRLGLLQDGDVGP